jgi:hypothetical protein
MRKITKGHSSHATIVSLLLLSSFTPFLLFSFPSAQTFPITLKMPAARRR